MISEFGVVFTGLSLLFLAIGVYIVYKQERALRSYEPTEATVVETDIDTDRSSAGSRPRKVVYQPVVEYRYHVDGKAYTTGNVYPGGTSSGDDRDSAESVISDYRQGETVTAHYDPANPDDAYLMKQRELTKFLFVVMPLGFLVMSLLSL